MPPATGQREHGDNRLDNRQLVVSAVIGAVLWFLAALLIRALEPVGALRDANIALTYVLTVPGTLPFVLLTRSLARLRRGQLLPGLAVATALATLLDGLALVIVPGLYGADTAGAGAVILWGAGVGLVLALLLERR